MTRTNERPFDYIADDINPAATPSTLLNSTKRHMIKIQQSNKRSYKAVDETERDIKQGDIEIKDSRFYNKT